MPVVTNKKFNKPIMIIINTAATVMAIYDNTSNTQTMNRSRERRG